ncbi:MAG: hypothetical protein B6244_07715 [Candidatus Cloacimonetes bacterium 4572_55]|nr:MAG: hypothetical protein B6244_07715 [Candidatus Cloacimonetes bacterium 4572_55]
MRKTIVFVFTLICMTAAAAFAQVGIKGRVSNSVYIYDDGESHTRLYQTARFAIYPENSRLIRINFFGRALNDISHDDYLDDEQKVNIFRLSLDAKGLLNNRLDVAIGRQFLHPGLTLGSIDGGNMTFRPNKKISLQVYGGVETHFFHSPELYESEDALVFGGTMRLRRVYDSELEAVYLQKNGPNDRIGEEEKSDGAQWRIVGANFKNRSIKPLRLYVQAHYDLLNKRMHRLYSVANYSCARKFRLSLTYKQQYPQVYDGSYFNREDLNKPFGDFEKYQQFGLSGGYFLTERFTANIGARMIHTEEGDGMALSTSLESCSGSVGLDYETGDFGNQIGVALAVNREIMSRLDLGLSVNYSRYRFLEEFYNFSGETVDTEYDRQVGNALRLSYRFSDHFRMDAEYQCLNNWLNYRDDDRNDHRFLNHIHYIW